MIFLTPEIEWIGRFEEWIAPQVETKRLSEMLGKASFGETIEEDIKLFIEGAKRIELKGDPCGYEKLVRQRAAVCLRGKRGVGALSCCALIADYLNQGGCKDEA